MQEFNFGEIEAALARLNHIADHKRVAFAGRLRILQKAGVPMRDTPGRGKAGAFTVDHAFQLALGVELLQCGLAPQRVGEIIRRQWWLKRDEILAALRLLKDTVQIDLSDPRSIDDPKLVLPWVWTVPLHELRDLSKLENGPDHINAITVQGLNKMAQHSLWSNALVTRTLIINPARIVLGLVRELPPLLMPQYLAQAIEDYSGLEPELDQAADLFLRVITDGKAKTLEVPGHIERFNRLIEGFDFEGAAKEDFYPVARTALGLLTEEATVALNSIATRLDLDRPIPARGKDMGGLGLLVDMGLLAPTEVEGKERSGPWFIATDLCRKFIKRWAEVWEFKDVYS